MIARGFKPVAWVAAIGTAALGCYMLSLQVAAERAELAAIDGRILRTQQAIRALHTELGTRGRLQQLERWNAEVLALSAPVAAQFLDSNVSLARFDVGPRRFAGEEPVRLATAEAPPAPAAPATATPATATAVATVRLAAAEAPPAPVAAAPEPPLVRRATLAVLPEPVPAATPARSDDAAPAAPLTLLDERTLRALTAESRTERGGRTRN